MLRLRAVGAVAVGAPQELAVGAAVISESAARTQPAQARQFFVVPFSDRPPDACPRMRAFVPTPSSVPRDLTCTCGNCSVRPAAAILTLMRRLLLAALLLSAPAGATSPNILLFDSGSARLDAIGERILDHAFVWLRDAGARRVLLEAGTDRVGSEAENFRLSRRRGEAVRDGLVRRGFPASAIRIAAYGESRPLVETRDGVPEPQNRYVYIEIVEMAPAASR